MARLFIAWIALVVLAAVSFGVSYLHLGGYGLPAAITIAALKAAIVLAVFMELSRERSSTRLVAAAAVFLLAVFIGFTAIDPAMRGELPAVRR